MLTRRSPATPETPIPVSSPFTTRRVSSEIQDFSSDEEVEDSLLREGGDTTVSSTDLWIDEALATARNEGMVAREEREETEGAEDKKESLMKKVRPKKRKNLKGINI